jgi:hypothetical protein
LADFSSTKDCTLVFGGSFAETMMDTIQPNVTGRSSFKVTEFCARNGISKGLYYKLDKLGRGPPYLLVGVGEQHRRITLEAEREWQAQQEAAAVARKAAKNQPAVEAA